MQLTHSSLPVYVWGSSSPEDQQPCLRGRDGGANVPAAGEPQPLLRLLASSPRGSFCWRLASLMGPSAVPTTPAASASTYLLMLFYLLEGTAKAANCHQIADHGLGPELVGWGPEN